jgi:hypothetical protein
VGLLTLDEAEDECRFMCGNDKDEDQPRVRRWLKFGLNYLCNPNVYRHPELEATENVTLVAGDVQTPTIVWNALEMVRFYDALTASVTFTTQGKRLQPTSMRMLLDRGIKVEGQPTRYAFHRNLLHLDRSVTTTDVGKCLRLEGMRKHRVLDLEADSETTDLRDDWDHLWVMAGAMFGFIWSAESGKAHGIRDSLGRLINDMPIVQDLSAVDWTDESSLESRDGMRPARY